MSQKIGAGAYAAVYSRQDVAIKKIPHTYYESWVRELALLRACNHPNIVKVSYFRCGRGGIQLHMKRYDQDLSQYLHSGAMTPQLVLSFARDIISAVTYMHARGIIHRDLKPSNILLDKATMRLVVCDLGISALGIEQQQRSGWVQTCSYRAPEVDYPARCGYRAAIDIWSIGCILFELCARAPLVVQERTEDSSWYACTAFGISAAGSRQERVARLKVVSRTQILGSIKARFIGAPGLKYKEIPHGIIYLIVNCLAPAPRKRINIYTCCKVVGRVPALLPRQLPHWAPDELSKTIYERYIYAARERNVAPHKGAKLAALCIAECICETERPRASAAGSPRLLGAVCAVIALLAGDIL